MTDIDLDFRPAGYGPQDRSIYPRYANLTGAARMQQVRRILIECERPTEWAVQLAYEELTEPERDWVGSTFILGEEPTGEWIEIARITLRSVHGEDIWIMARPVAEGFEYEIVQDIMPELTVNQAFRESKEPLTLRELAALIDGSSLEDDGHCDEGGLVTSFWNAELECCSAKQAVKFTLIDSIFYPQLSDYYDRAAREWVREVHKNS